jgi:hypothetical protein
MAASSEGGDESEKALKSEVGSIRTLELSTQLIEAGVDPVEFSPEKRRALLGLHPEPDEALLVVTTEDFRKGRSHRFGKRNPEQIDEPFWDRMIRAGISAYKRISSGTIVCR